MYNRITDRSIYFEMLCKIFLFKKNMSEEIKSNFNLEFIQGKKENLQGKISFHFSF